MADYATDPRVCLNPFCPDDNPVLFSWLGSKYCSWNCQWSHRHALAEQPAQPPDLVVTIETDVSRFDAAMEEARQAPAVHPVMAAHAEVQRSFQTMSEMVGPPCPDGDVATGFARLRKRWLG